MNSKVIVTIDHGHVRCLESSQPRGATSLHVAVAAEWQLPEGRAGYYARDTDSAGRFPGSKGRPAGMSVDERLPMQEEHYRRIHQEIASHVTAFLQQRPGKEWIMAAAPELHRAVLELIAPEVRKRCVQVVPKNLATVPANEIRDHIKP